MANVHDVAAYVTRHFEGSISTMKLQKLCYIAQGWSLAFRDKPMFSEDFQAWANGPVCRELYDNHRGEYSVSEWPWGDPAGLDPAQKVILNGVLRNYEALSGLQLSELTHQPETPWSRTRGALPPSARSESKISNDEIREHYRDKLGLRPF